MCEEFYHYHICWLLTIRVTVVFGLLLKKFFLAFSGCERILMKDERANGEMERKQDGKKHQYLVQM